MRECYAHLIIFSATVITSFFKIETGGKPCPFAILSNVREALMLSVKYQALRWVYMGSSLLCRPSLDVEWLTLPPPNLPSSATVQAELWQGASNNESLLVWVTVADNQFTGWERQWHPGKCELKLSHSTTHIRHNLRKYIFHILGHFN